MNLDEIRRKVLNCYKDSCDYLQTVEVNGDSATGTFLIKESCYFDLPIKHLTDVEAQICLNQLGYVLLAQILSERRPGPLYHLTADDFWTLFVERALIVSSFKRFAGPVDRSHYFRASLNLNRVLKNLLNEKEQFLFFTFTFEGGEITGDLTASLPRQR